MKSANQLDIDNKAYSLHSYSMLLRRKVLKIIIISQISLNMDMLNREKKKLRHSDFVPIGNIPALICKFLQYSDRVYSKIVQ